MMFIGGISFQDEFTIEVTAAKTIYVPGNYTTIQDAIDNATSGDTIHVWAGTYYGNVLVNKTVTLIGNGTTNTTIDGVGNGDVVKITADWVNMSGFKIQNSGNEWAPYYDAGLELNNVQNVTVSNLDCKDNKLGIFLRDSNNNIITNNTCDSNNNGISLLDSTFNIIKNNTCSTNNWRGIHLQNSNQNKIESNTCMDNNCGIYIFYSTLNTIMKNKCDSNFLGIHVNISRSNRISDNSCNNSGNNGIDIRNSNFNLVENNKCFINGVNSTGKGIVLWLYSDSNIVANNSCNSNYEGIVIFNSNSNNIINNIVNFNDHVGIGIQNTISTTIMNNRLISTGFHNYGEKLEFWNSHTIDSSNTLNGKPIYYWQNRTSGSVPLGGAQIVLANCTNVKIENQTMIDEWFPIKLGFSRLNIIKNNLIKNTTFCPLLHYSDNNIISNNSFILNKGNGLRIISSKGNIIVNNNLSKNDLNGIFLNHSNENTIANNDVYLNNMNGIRLRDSNNNRIYYNNIINNVIQALELDESNNNNWDNGNFEGNYWSDYNGLDNGENYRAIGDGIGDTELPHYGLDYYPFVNKSGWEFPGVPILFDPGELSSDGNYTVSWFDNRGTMYFILEEDTRKDFDSPIIVYNGTDFRFCALYKPNNTYYYRLKACSEDYESCWSNIVDITVDWAPAKPQNLTVSAYPEGNALNLSWNSDAVDVKLYEIYYKSEKMTGWEFLSSVSYPKYAFDHTGLEDGLKYEYKIKALDIRGQESKFSNMESGIPRDTVPPSVPEGLSISEITNDSIELIWTPIIETDLDGYNIYRYTTATPDGWGDLIGFVPAGNNSFIDDGLKELTQYYYAVTAFDEVPNESNASSVVSATTEKTKYRPVINNSIENLSIDEDTIDNSTINLYHWFYDRNSEPLLFWCEGDIFINVTILQNNGKVILKPEKNWYGVETLTFYVSDGVFGCSDIVIITVNPVNDPPAVPTIIEPIDLTEIRHGTPLNLRGECNDPDLPNENLTFKWTSNLQGDLGSGDNLTEIILIAGVHEITLTVIDIIGESSSVNITVKVLKSQPSERGNENNIYLAIAYTGLFILTLVILIFFTITLKKHREKIETSKAKAPPTSRFSFLSLQVPDTTITELDSKTPKTTNPENKIPISKPSQQNIKPGQDKENNKRNEGENG